VSLAAAEAQQVLLSAQIAGRLWLEPLRERAEALTLRTAELLIDAHTRVEEADGVARAVGFACRGDTWTPRRAPNRGRSVVWSGDPAGWIAWRRAGGRHVDRKLRRSLG